MKRVIFLLLFISLSLRVFSSESLTLFNYEKENYNRHPFLLEEDRRSGEVVPFSEGIDIFTSLDKVWFTLGGESQGVLPWSSSDLSAGTYRMLFEKRGYRSEEILVDLAPGTRLEILVQLEPLTEERDASLEKQEVEQLFRGEGIRLSPRRVYSPRRFGLTPVRLTIPQGTREALEVSLDGENLYGEEEASEDAVKLDVETSSLEIGIHKVIVRVRLEGEWQEFQETLTIQNSYDRLFRGESSSAGDPLSGASVCGEAFADFRWLYVSDSKESLFPVNVGFLIVPLDRLQIQLSSRFYLNPETRTAAVEPDVRLSYRYLHIPGLRLRGAVSAGFHYWGYTDEFGYTRSDLGFFHIPSFTLRLPLTLELDILSLFLDPEWKIAVLESPGMTRGETFSDAHHYLSLYGGLTVETGLFRGSVSYGFHSPPLNLLEMGISHSGLVSFSLLIPRSGFILSLFYAMDWSSTEVVSLEGGLQFSILF